MSTQSFWEVSESFNFKLFETAAQKKAEALGTFRWTLHLQIFRHLRQNKASDRHVCAARTGEWFVYKHDFCFNVLLWGRVLLHSEFKDSKTISIFLIRLRKCVTRTYRTVSGRLCWTVLHPNTTGVCFCSTSTVLFWNSPKCFWINYLSTTLLIVRYSEICFCASCTVAGLQCFIHQTHQQVFNVTGDYNQ